LQCLSLQSLPLFGSKLGFLGNDLLRPENTGIDSGISLGVLLGQFMKTGNESFRLLFQQNLGQFDVVDQRIRLRRIEEKFFELFFIVDFMGVETDKLGETKTVFFVSGAILLADKNKQTVDSLLQRAQFGVIDGWFRFVEKRCELAF